LCLEYKPEKNPFKTILFEDKWCFFKEKKKGVKKEGFLWHGKGIDLWMNNWLKEMTSMYTARRKCENIKTNKQNPRVQTGC
jgi:hypothetical protein